MSNYKALLLTLIVCFFIPHLQLTGQATNGNPRISLHNSDYPEMLEYTFNYTDIGNFAVNCPKDGFTSSASFIQKFSTNGSQMLRDVTTIAVYVWTGPSMVDHANVSLSLNGHEARNSYYLTEFPAHLNLYFVIDDSAMILFNAENEINLTVQASFEHEPYWNSIYLDFPVRGIQIKTVYRPRLGDLGPLNETNSKFTAVIIDKKYIIPVNNYVLFNNTNNAVGLNYVMIYFLVVLPWDVEHFTKNCYLTITIEYNLLLNILQFRLEDFTIISSTTKGNSVSYFLRYMRSKPSGVARGLFEFYPRAQAVYHVNFNGQYFIANEPVKLFPESNEMGIALFINATLVIPLVALSKLIYRRFFY